MTPERRAEIEAMGRSYRNYNQSGWEVDDIIRELLAEIDRLNQQWCPVCMRRYGPLHPELLQRSQHDPAQPDDDEE